MLKDQLVLSMLINVIEDSKNLPIVECLIDGVETDEEIHEKTEIKLNVVRKVLYKLYDAGLASYKRSKDPETQWYTYSWKFEPEEIMMQMEKISNKEIENLTKLLQEEENNIYFICPNNHIRCDFNESSEYEFICPECGEELEFQDNSEFIEAIKEEISILKKDYENFIKKNKK